MNKYPSQDNTNDDIQDKNGTNEKEDNLIKNGGNDNVDETSIARADLDGVNMDNGEDILTTKRKLSINCILLFSTCKVNSDVFLVSKYSVNYHIGQSLLLFVIFIDPFYI